MSTTLTVSAPNRWRGWRTFATVAASASVLASVALAAPVQAQGDGTAVHTTVVSDNPADYTPNVKDGVVHSVVQVGNLIVIGGSFSSIVRGTTIFTRTSLAAFDATTGVVSTTFAPTLDGEVTSLEVGADGTSIYAGGAFNTVNGATHRKLVRLSVTNGSVVTAFKNAAFDGAVNDVRRVGTTLWVAGKFAKVGSTTRPALVSLDATTAAVTTKSTAVFAGLHNGGTLSVREMSITPAGDKLLAVGNFTTVDGLARDQAVLLNIGGATAVVSGWQTNFFAFTCNLVFDTYLRDVAISPDGTYAVFATTGSYRANTSCDTVSRLEISGSSPDVKPTWVNMTGGDTTTAVTIVGSVVYIGGHFRWLNNPNAADKTGQGAVARTGLAALNPSNGLPYAWNPTRERGYGVYDFLATPQGLWVASDTATLGGEFRERIGFFPLAGGATLPTNKVGSVPGDVLAVGPGNNPADSVSRTDVSGSVQPGTTSTMTGADSWSQARGAMLVDSTLFTAWDNGRIYASTVSGTSIAAKTETNLNAGPFCTTLTSVCNANPILDPPSANRSFNLDAPTITGMFYDASKMYYTISGGSQLYFRYFNPQSGLVGATRYQASGGVATLNPSRVRGMFLAGGLLYFADSTTGNLSSIGFSGGVVGSTLATVNSTRDWRARGLALRAQPAGNQPPTAAITNSCTFLACSFSGWGSSDSDGSIASYAWTFGDGATGTGVSANRTYAAAGTYTVGLTVTDNNGATASTTKPVTVASTPTSSVAFRASTTASASGGGAIVTTPGTVQVGDLLLLFVTANGSTTFTPPAGWTLVREEFDGTPDMVTRVYSHTAIAGDANKLVTVAIATTQKSATTMVAYSGVSSAPPVSASSPEAGTTAAHAAPPVAVATAGSWVVHYWADKTAGTTSWLLPGTVFGRAQVLGSGSGQVGGVTADSNGPVPTGTWPGATATSSTSGSKATSFSIVLNPA